MEPSPKFLLKCWLSRERPAPGRHRSIVPQRVSLVVDDEPAIRHYIAAILRRADFQIIEAEDGIRALGVVQEIDGRIDLIVSDIRMPNGDGLSFACKVKKQFPNLPIILISGTDEGSSEFEGFISKPFGPAELLRAVEEVVAGAAESSPVS